MSWIVKLYDTYNNCQNNIGEKVEGKRPLLPAFHSSQIAHIEVVIDGDGNFLRASVIPKSVAGTIIPCTEDSATRTGLKPHPLNDQLKYLAGDLPGYEKYQLDYVNRLSDWCSSAYANNKIRAILTYVQKKRLLDDLFKSNILLSDENGMLITKVKNSAEAPEAYKLVPGEIVNAFCRFCVEISGEVQSHTYEDIEVFNSWIEYANSQTTEEGLCYASGKLAVLASKHPKFIRHTGDGAKLISSNDSDNFTYRGMFSLSAEACGVSNEVSHKAHSALKWLISRQAYTKYGHTVLAWTTTDNQVPRPLENDFDIYAEENQSFTSTSDTAQGYAIRLGKAIAGYRQKLSEIDGINIIALDSVVPGRLSITYYREFEGNQYLDRLQNWYSTCCWNMKYFRDKLPYIAIGTPTPIDIVYATHGENSDDKIKHATIERLIPCILENSPLPVDLLKKAVIRTSNRSNRKSFRTEDDWDRALDITCAMFYKINQKEGYLMALDESRVTRDYLYGRLIAIADNLEKWALKEGGDKRPTTANRYFARFATQPYRTWQIIEEALQSYIMKLGGKANFHVKLIDSVMDKFQNEDYMDNRQLSGEYLLGYHNQREFFNKKINKTNTEENTENE